MSFADSPLYSRRVYSFLCLSFFGIALTFLIVATSLHQLYSFNAASIPEEFTAPVQLSITGSVHIGAFHSCIDVDGTVGADPTYTWSIHQCFTLPTNCKAHFAVQTADGEVDINEELEGFSCAQFNAFRAFLVMGIIFLGVGAVLALLSLEVRPDDRRLMWATVAVHVLADLCVVIAYALVADHMKKVNNEILRFDTGSAFALAVTAWVLMVLGLALFGLVKRFEREGYSKGDDMGEAKRLPA